MKLECGFQKGEGFNSVGDKPPLLKNTQVASKGPGQAVSGRSWLPCVLMLKVTTSLSTPRLA